MTVSEEIQKIGRRTESGLRPQYSEMEWKNIMGFRDFRVLFSLSQIRAVQLQVHYLPGC